MKLRAYQEGALFKCKEAFRSAKSVLLVAPTGSGKTVMGAEIVRRTLEHRPGLRVLWICHRAELRQQATLILAGLVGQSGPPSWRVETAQTLIARKDRPPAELIVFDEAHHYRSAEWGEISKAYPGAWSLGLTATPQRSDGKSLGSMFEKMVVAAKYSELIEGGHLVPCRTLRPERYLGTDGVAQDPVDAYRKHGEGRQAFFFVPPGSSPSGLVERLWQAGIPAAAITSKTPKELRARALHNFRLGKIQALVNIYCLTEGVDVPAASCCVLARGVGHAGQFLQIVGRILRPAPNKKDGLLIDLSGASHVHGLPGQDVAYSLDGDGIEAEGQRGKAGKAGEPGSAEDRPQPKIYSLALRAVFAGEETPGDAKDEEWVRLSGLARSRGWGIAWAAKEYKKLFGCRPPQVAQVPLIERKKEYLRFLAFARSRGHKDGQAAYRYRDLFGTWPPFAWRK